MAHCSRSALTAIVVCLALSMPGLASAQTFEPYAVQYEPRIVWPGMRTILKSDNQISASFVGSHIGYNEFNDPSRSGGTDGVIDSENGWMPGAHVSFSLVERDPGIRHLYFAFNGIWLNGHTNYWSASETLVDHDVIKTGEIRIGVLAPLGYGIALTYYAGIGARQWNRTLEGPRGYREVYSNEYAGGGLLFQKATSPQIVFTIDVFIGSTFGGSMQSSRLPGGYPITPEKYTLRDRPLIRVSGRLDDAITQHFHLNTSVSYTRFKFGESPLVSNLSYEPNSASTVISLEVGLGYGF